MTSRDFCYWLQGLFELQNPTSLNKLQTKLIKQHLNLVFMHEIDPSFTKDEDVQNTMKNIHDGVENVGDSEVPTIYSNHNTRIMC